MGQHRVSEDALLTELRRLARNLDKTPSQRDMNAYGEYSHMVYTRRFESWNAAIEKADLTPNNGRGTTTVSDSDLLDELERLAEDLERSPSISDMDDRGAYRAVTYQRRFGSWNAAKEKVGLDIHRVDGGQPNIAYLLANGPAPKSALPEKTVTVEDRSTGVASFRVSSTESSPEANGGPITPVYYLHSEHEKTAVLRAFLDTNDQLVEAKSRHGLIQTVRSAGREWGRLTADVLDGGGP